MAQIPLFPLVLVMMPMVIVQIAQCLVQVHPNVHPNPQHQQSWQSWQQRFPVGKQLMIQPIPTATYTATYMNRLAAVPADSAVAYYIPASRDSATFITTIPLNNNIKLFMQQPRIRPTNTLFNKRINSDSSVSGFGSALVTTTDRPCSTSSSGPSKLQLRKTEQSSAQPMPMDSVTSASHNYPVYVLPPKDFQPIIYHQTSSNSNSKSLASFFSPLLYQHQQVKPRPTTPSTNGKIKTPEEIRYEQQTGSSSSTTNNNNYNSISMTSSGSGNSRQELKQGNSYPEQSHDKLLKQHKIFIIPLQESNLDNEYPIPMFEATSMFEYSPSSASVSSVSFGNSNPYVNSGSHGGGFHSMALKTQSKDDMVDGNKRNKNLFQRKDLSTSETMNKSVANTSSTTSSTNTPTNNKRQLKTKLAVGLTSFFLGGTRGVTGRHWKMPANLIEKLEFMPNSNPSFGLENQYYPEETETEPDPLLVSSEDDRPEKEDMGINFDDDDNFNGNDGQQQSKPIESQKNKIKKKKNPFEFNTIIDSLEDLEAQESQTYTTTTVLPLFTKSSSANSYISSKK